MILSDVIIVSDQESLVSDIVYCFQASGLEITHTVVENWDALVRLGDEKKFEVVLADCHLEELPVNLVLDFSRKNNPNCLFYGLFDTLDEDEVSMLLHTGATSFALKNNLFRLAAAVQKALDNERYEILVPDAVKREYFLSSFFEQATEAIWVKDKDGKYLLINPAGAQFISKPIEDIIGRYDEDIFPKDTADKIRKSDEFVMLSGNTQVIEDSIINQEHVERIFQAVKTVLRDRNGEVQGLMGSGCDPAQAR